MELTLEEVKSVFQEFNPTDVLPDDQMLAMLTWINSDVENRVQVLDDTLNFIKYECCSSLKLKEILTKFEVITSKSHIFCDVIRKILLARKTALVVIDYEMQTKCWKIVGERCEEVTEIPYESTADNISVCPCEGVGFMVTGGVHQRGCPPTNRCAVYHAAANVWKRMKNFRSIRHMHASACILGELFVMGGDVSGTCNGKGSVEFLNMEENDEWQSGPEMPFFPTHPRVAYLGTSVFLMRACDPHLYHFDAAQKIWSIRARIYDGSPGGGFSMAAGKRETAIV